MREENVAQGLFRNLILDGSQDVVRKDKRQIRWPIICIIKNLWQLRIPREKDRKLYWTLIFYSFMKSKMKKKTEYSSLVVAFNLQRSLISVQYVANVTYDSLKALGHFLLQTLEIVNILKYCNVLVEGSLLFFVFFIYYLYWLNCEVTVWQDDISLDRDRGQRSWRSS